MSVTADILESWRRPRVVVRRLLDQGRSEPFAFSLLVAGLILFYISRTPQLARIAHDQPGKALTPWLLGSALGLAATVPLWYVIAALGHLVAKWMGGKGSAYGARIALFWALIASSPALLASGLVSGFRGNSAIFGVIAAAVFVVFWTVMLREAERA